MTDARHLSFTDGTAPSPAVPADIRNAASRAVMEYAFQQPSVVAPVQRLNGNTLSGDDHHNAIALALRTIAETVGRTLGPFGSNTLIRDAHGAHTATKDGYTVLTRLTFAQETATMVLDHVREVSRAMVRKVGDGSTSAVVMADALYRTLRNRRAELVTFPPGAVQSAISVLGDVLAEKILTKTVPINSDADILRVALISANNDPRVGALVVDAYREHGSDSNVFVQAGDGLVTTVTQEPGYRVLRGMARDCFANVVSTDSVAPTVCALQNPRVMIIAEMVTMPVFASTVAPAMNASLAEGRAFVLVAKDYEHGVLDTIANFMSKSPGAPLLLLDHAVATRRGAARLGDLAAVVGATAIGMGAPMPTDVKLALAMCGTNVASVRATLSETVFAGAVRSANASARADEIQAQLERVDISNNAEALTDELNELRARRRAILGSETTIMVGGATVAERRALADLLDDATLAVKSALRGGVVEGMGLTAVRCLVHDDSLRTSAAARLAETTTMPIERAAKLMETVHGAFFLAFWAAAQKVLENARVASPEDVIRKCVRENLAFNVITGQFSAEPTVINPVETDIEVIRGAASIVSLFIASEQTVLTRAAVGNGMD